VEASAIRIRRCGDVLAIVLANDEQDMTERPEAVASERADAKVIVAA
jgi:hypothetical protein